MEQEETQETPEPGSLAAAQGAIEAANQQAEVEVEQDINPLISDDAGDAGDEAPADDWRSILMEVQSESAVVYEEPAEEGGEQAEAEAAAAAQDGLLVGDETAEVADDGATDPLAESDNAVVESFTDGYIGDDAAGDGLVGADETPQEESWLPVRSKTSGIQGSSGIQKRSGIQGSSGIQGASGIQ